MNTPSDVAGGKLVVQDTPDWSEWACGGCGTTIRGFRRYGVGHDGQRRTDGAEVTIQLKERFGEGWHKGEHGQPLHGCPGLHQALGLVLNELYPKPATGPEADDA